jgi:hypothetical protein
MPELLPAGLVEPLLLPLLLLLELPPFVVPPLPLPPPLGEPPLLVLLLPQPGEPPLPEPLPLVEPPLLEPPPLDPPLEPPLLLAPHFAAPPPELAPVICGDSVHPPESLPPHPRGRAAAAATATIHTPRRGDSFDHHPRLVTRCKRAQPRAKSILLCMSASQAARPAHASSCYLDVSLEQRFADLHTKAGLPTLGCVV